MVILRGKVEASTSDSYSAENHYSLCFCGDRDDDVDALPPTKIPIDNDEPGNCRVAVIADYSYLSRASPSDIDDLMNEANKIFKDNFDFGIGESHLLTL
jgi:hypothetical protein